MLGVFGWYQLQESVLITFLFSENGDILYVGGVIDLKSEYYNFSLNIDHCVPLSIYVDLHVGGVIQHHNNQ